MRKGSIQFSVSGRAFVVVDETAEQVCLCAAMSITGSRERQ
jgi:hypothetical protein